MNLGEVIRKERERMNLAPKEVASDLGITVKEFEDIESGNSLAENWGPKLAQIAIELEIPISRLISKNGKSDGATIEKGLCGVLIRAKRKAKGLNQDEFAELLDMPLDEVSAIENGTSPLESYAPILLGFAELIKQPIFNLFYPCGVPFQQIENY